MSREPLYKTHRPHPRRRARLLRLFSAAITLALLGAVLGGVSASRRAPEALSRGGEVFSGARDRLLGGLLAERTRVEQASAQTAPLTPEHGLRQALLPEAVIPLGMVATGASLVPNEHVAALSTDPEGARDHLAQAGRVEGAWLEYQLPVEAEDARSLAVTSSVTIYESVEAAAAILPSPPGALTLERFGVLEAETIEDVNGGARRRFRPPLDGETPRYITYLVQFRREHIVGSLTLVVPTGMERADDLAFGLARYHLNRLAAAVAEGP